MAIQDKMKKLVDDYCMPIIGNVEKERFLPDLDFDMMYGKCTGRVKGISIRSCSRVI